ncbi:hypothetical protein [Bacillus luti]|uniref:Uncharacterized protein n=1 Tax=Bacillus luti TaxID=2026191 RepID=A0A7V7V3H9_9BACI|nr:hypothetical protein [Bacillus luti]KAB2441369.1 hypothetical protein F8163_21655 [Bacillus luti]
MAKYYGYSYDENGKFTEMVPIEEKPIYEKQTFYREEQKGIVTEEKLCDFHQSIEDGALVADQNPLGKFDCPDCVLHRVDFEPIQVPYQEDVIVGYEPDIPNNCTLEVCPWLAYEPVFDGEKWVKTKEPEIVEPQPQEPSELEKLKKQMELLQKAMDEMIIAGIQ